MANLIRKKLYRIKKRLLQVKDEWQDREGFFQSPVDSREEPGKPVEMFQAVFSKQNKEHSIDIFGDPMHNSRRKITRKLKTQKIDAFLRHEARHGIGNYIIVQRRPGYIRIITSPGYCGGYFYEKGGNFSAATLLAPVLKHIPGEVEMEPFGLCLFLAYAPHSNFNLLPFTTMFKDVLRIPPGSILEFEGGKLTKFSSYLCMPDRLDPPNTFNKAMVEVTQGINAYFKRIGRMRAAVMFSGGVDSAAIYLGLREVLGKRALRLFTMVHSASNGPDRAWPVATSLDAETEIIGNQVYEDGEIYDKVVSWMNTDIPAISSPHLVFLKMALQDTVVFHGQNMDALINIHMEVLQETHEAGYLSKAGMKVAKTEDRKKRQHRAFLRNLQLTDSYLNDPHFQKLTVGFYADTHNGLLPDPAPGSRGVLRGMLSSQFPNLLAPNTIPLDQVTYLDREVDRFLAYIGETAANDPRMSLDMLRFVGHAHLANKRATTFELSHNSRPLFMAMSGPLTSYYLGRARSLTDASQPKREVYAYLRHLGGAPYRAMIRPKSDHPPAPSEAPGPTTTQRLDGLLERVTGNLNPEQSRLLASVQDPDALQYVAGIYDSSLAHYKASLAPEGHVRVTVFQKQILLKLANLEKLLDSRFTSEEGVGA